MMKPSSNRLCVLFLGTLRLLVLRTLDSRGRAHRVGEPVMNKADVGPIGTFGVEVPQRIQAVFMPSVKQDHFSS